MPWDCAWYRFLVAIATKAASFSIVVLQPLGSSKAAVHTNKRFQRSTAWVPGVGSSGWSQPQHRLSILNLGQLCHSHPRCCQGRGQLFPLLWATALCHSPPVVGPSGNVWKCTSISSTPYLKSKGWPQPTCLQVTEAESRATKDFSSVVEGRSVLVVAEPEPRVLLRGFAR